MLMKELQVFCKKNPMHKKRIKTPQQNFVFDRGGVTPCVHPFPPEAMLWDAAVP